MPIEVERAPARDAASAPVVVAEDHAMRPRLGLIRNPASGRAAGRLWPRFESALRRRFPELALRETSGPGDAARLARDMAAEGFDTIVAVGGDGTLSEVAAGLVAAARPQTALAALPLGSGCDFLRNLPMPAEPAAFSDRLALGARRSVDLGQVAMADGARRPFVNILSLGVSGCIVGAVNRRRRRPALNGELRYFLQSMIEILRYRPVTLRVLCDDREVFSGPVAVVAIANGGWFGGGMHIAPRAVIDDGLFEVAIMRHASRRHTLGLLMRLRSAAHVGHPLMSFYQASRVVVLPLDGSRPQIEADGEYLGEGGLTAEILPAALSIAC